MSSFSDCKRSLTKKGLYLSVKSPAGEKTEQLIANVLVISKPNKNRIRLKQLYKISKIKVN